MSKNSLQASNEKRHVLGLIRKYGLTGARRELLKEGKKAPCLLTLSKLAEAEGITVPGRGRPAVYVGKVKAHILSLIRKFGGYKAVREALTAEGLPVPSTPVLVDFAKEAGVSIKRGRPVVEAA